MLVLQTVFDPMFPFLLYTLSLYITLVDDNIMENYGYVSATDYTTTSADISTFYEINTTVSTFTTGNKKASIRWQDSARRQFQSGRDL